MIPIYDFLEELHPNNSGLSNNGKANSLTRFIFASSFWTLVYYIIFIFTDRYFYKYKKRVASLRPYIPYKLSFIDPNFCTFNNGIFWVDTSSHS